jgi:hypothetical protein
VEEISFGQTHSKMTLDELVNEVTLSKEPEGKAFLLCEEKNPPMPRKEPRRKEEVRSSASIPSV